MLGFTICDGDGVPVLQLAQSCTCSKHHEFPILDLTGEKKIGKIIKLFGLADMAGATNADQFEVHFPVDIDVRIKAACIAAVFLFVSKYYHCTYNYRFIIGYDVLRKQRLELLIRNTLY